MPFINEIIAYEQGELDDEQTLELFQHLVDTGLAWKLQGSYGRAAMAYIEAGLIERCTCKLHGALACPRHGP